MPTISSPAASLDDLYDLESGLEGPILNALRASGIFDPERERSNAEALTPRVELRVQVGACTAKSKLPVGATDPRQGLPNAWKVNFQFDVVTDRKAPKQVVAHGVYRAKIRRLGGQFMQILNPHIPWFRIEEMMENGTQTRLENADALTEDISRIAFAGIVTVKAHAWPVGT